MNAAAEEAASHLGAMALVGRETGAIEIRAMEEGGVRKKVHR